MTYRTVDQLGVAAVPPRVGVFGAKMAVRATCRPGAKIGDTHQVIGLLLAKSLFVNFFRSLVYLASF